MKSLLAVAGVLLNLAPAIAASCYCLPGDACWPSASTWASLNSTVSGRLIGTVPLGSPCHDPTYNETQCAALQAAWYLPKTHYNSAHSVMQGYFANQSCDPFTAESKACTIGNYVSYAVNVQSTADVVAAINFAKANNVRLIVRNTGHDFLGRSTGAGALAVWTHNLKNISFSDWSCPLYKGKAVTFGAGIQGGEAIEAANAQGLAVVSGSCPTVGLAGGYTQAGGHGILSTEFGLAADQTLEFEVVTAAGKVVKASSTQNADLYWALSGGGPSTYGIVTAVTVRAHPSATVGGAAIQFAAAYTTADKFYQAVSTFHSLIPQFTDAGANIAFYFNNQFFVINPVTVYNSTAASVKDMLAPFTQTLTNLSIPFSSAYTELSYRDHYNQYFELPDGHINAYSYQFGGRFIPRTVLETNNAALQTVLRNITNNGVLAVSVALNATAPQGVSNAVLPNWRNTAVHMQLTTPWNETAPWEEMIADQLQITNEFVPQVTSVTPGAGAYMNEADFRQPDFQSTFFGSNYAKLLAIKKKWDPSFLFYGTKLVGSEHWTVAADGRMCTA